MDINVLIGPPRGFQRHGYQRFNSTQFSSSNEEPPQRYYNQPSYSNNSYVPSHGFRVPPPRPQRPQAYRPPLSPDATCLNISNAAAVSMKIQDIPSNADSTNHPKKLNPIISNNQKKDPKMEEKKEAKRIRFENAKKRLEGYLAEALEEFEADYEKVKTDCGGTISEELQNEYNMKVQHLHDLHNGQIDLLYKIIIEGKWYA
uniref:Uncharacterized protein n=1 Tax=Panagrolaimus davidi TaxID=227884 RepID=A0A914QGG1_9BILA